MKRCEKISSYDWLIDFNTKSTHLELFHAQRLDEPHLLYVDIYIFLCSCFLKEFFHTRS